MSSSNSFAIDSTDLITNPQDNAIARVIVEEYGHSLNSQFNSIDASRDEGYLLVGLAQQKYFKESNISTAVINNQAIQIEQANPGVNPAFDLIGLTQLRNDPQFAEIDGSGFSVAVIDTGIDTDHPLLVPNYIAGYDFLDNDSIPEDTDGHGTHIAGTIGAVNQNIGVAPGVNLIGLRVLDGNGGSLTEIEAALEWVLENRELYNITAVNLSLGVGFFSSETGIRGDIISDNIQRLEEAGVTVVAAAGNDYFTNAEELNRENLAFPAISSTVAVGAVWQSGTESNVSWQSGSIDYTTGVDRIASFSQRLDTANVVFAPGALITSTLPGGGIGVSGGTSQASPHVAGAIALIQEASLEFSGRLLTTEEIREILFTTGDLIVDGDDEDDNVINTNNSYVRINVYNAITEVKTRSDNLASGDSNGTITGAFIGPILDGSPVSPLFGSIGRDGADVRDSDVDVYRFQIASPGVVGIEIANNSDNPSDFNSYLRLFDSSGNEIANNDNIADNNLFSRLDVTLEPGTYYVGISGVGNVSYDPNVPGSGVAGDTGNYALQFSLNNQDPNGVIVGAQEVNLGSDLEPLVYSGVIGADYGETVESDVDLLRLVAPDNGVICIDIDTPYSSDYVDSYVRLFDANGNPLVTADQPIASDNHLAVNKDGIAVEFLAPDNSEIVLETKGQTELISGIAADGSYQQGNYGHTSDSFVAVRVERGQIYYVGISDASNQDYDINNLNNRPQNGNGGRYQLTTTFVNDDLNGSITQVKQVTPLPMEKRTASIGKDGEQQVGDRDVDFYKLNSANEGILEISTVSEADESVNTTATIFDSQGRRLGFNDQLNSNNSELRYQITPNTDYYVAIAGYGNQNFDPFALGSGAGGDTGTYTINGNLIPLEAAGNLVDNTIGSSAVQNIASGETIFGNIGNDSGFIIGNSDVDIYRFIPDTNSVVDIRTSTSEEFSADTYLRVFDSFGNEIAANDDQSELNQSSFIQLEVTADTEYYIGVNGSSQLEPQYNPITGENATPGSKGDYNLSISSNDIVTGSIVHRFFRPDLGVHFYTASDIEKNSIIASLPNYTYEGESYISAPNADFLTGVKPVYRFLNTDTGAHLYTISEAEKESVTDNSSYTYEGIAYYGYESDRLGAIPLYRFYNLETNTHFYTPSAVEKDAILNNFPNYQLESNDGVAFYVEPIDSI